MTKEEKQVLNNTKPCKLCGYKPKLRWFSLYFDETDLRYSIICSNENCINRVNSQKNLNQTIDMWNSQN